MSSHHGDLSLPDLLAQVDSLQQQLKDLGRQVEAEENHVACLEEKITKDQEKEAKLRQDASNISRELLEWEDREKFLAGAIDSNYKNYQVLKQMEVEERALAEKKRQAELDAKEKLEKARALGEYIKKAALGQRLAEEKEKLRQELEANQAEREVAVAQKEQRRDAPSAQPEAEEPRAKCVEGLHQARRARRSRAGAVDAPLLVQPSLLHGGVLRARQRPTHH